MHTRKNPRRNSSSLKIIPESHLDHGLTQAHIDYILSKFADKTGFFIETLTLPAHLPSLQDALYGPLVGDKPVTESAVHYAKRGERPGESRMIHKPFRETRHLTVIAGPYGSDPVVLYTAFGGKLAPKEPFDPSLNPQQKAESEAFWSQHALATGEQSSKRANSSNRKTTQDFTHLSDAELEARITTASQGMQYWRGYNPAFYDMAEKELDALEAEKKRRARPNTTVHVHDFDCPSCGAPAGYYCNSPKGKALKTPHKARGARNNAHPKDVERAWDGDINLAGADLSSANLPVAFLAGVNLTGAHLEDANLTGADLREANLTSAFLAGANLTGAHLESADLTGAYLSSANLQRANLESADLTGANLALAKLKGANLNAAKLPDANLTGANLEGAKLSSADLTGAKLSGAKLNGAKLTGADLNAANLLGADLTNADLRDANLASAGLEGANLSGADLSGVELDDADLTGANLSGAKLYRVRWTSNTRWPARFTPPPRA